MEVSYNPQVHGDPLLYPEAFVPVPGTKVQRLIHQMEPESLQLWSQYYLFQESLGEIADIRGLRAGLSDEDSDAQSTAMSSRRTPTGCNAPTRQDANTPTTHANGRPPEDDAENGWIQLD